MADLELNAARLLDMWECYAVKVYPDKDTCIADFARIVAHTKPPYRLGPFMVDVDYRPVADGSGKYTVVFLLYCVTGPVKAPVCRVNGVNHCKGKIIISGRDVLVAVRVDYDRFRNAQGSYEPFA